MTVAALRPELDAERMAWIRARLATAPPGDARGRALLLLAHEALRRRLAEAAAAAPARREPLADLLGGAREVTDYPAMVGEVRTIAAEVLPRGARVLVVSRGDPELVRLDGLAASHFPQAPSGEWAGYYPADGDAAVAHLELLRREGHEFLLVPATARWWLEYYRELAALLASTARVVEHRPACTIFALSTPPEEGAA